MSAPPSDSRPLHERIRILARRKHAVVEGIRKKPQHGSRQDIPNLLREAGWLEEAAALLERMA